MTYLAIIANPHSTSSQAGYYLSAFYGLALFMFLIFLSWLVCVHITKFVYFVYILHKIKRGLFSPGSTSYAFQILTFIKDSIYVIFIGIVTYVMTWVVFFSLLRFGVEISKLLTMPPLNVGMILIPAFLLQTLSAVLYGLWLAKRLLPMDLALLQRIGLLKNIPSSS